MHRYRIKIVGQSGSGLLTVGDLFVKGLLQLGFCVYSDREFPSLIKGGHSCFTIHFSEEELHSLSEKTDTLAALDKLSLVTYFPFLENQGLLIHGYDDKKFGIRKILEETETKKIKVLSCESRRIALENGGNVLMSNMVLMGMIWKAFGFPMKIMKDLVQEKFEKKQMLLDPALTCFQSGFDLATPSVSVNLPKTVLKRQLLEGNYALALGAIHCGMRAYFAYPMSPSSSILTHIADIGPKFGVVVKQAEDEITAVQMVLGALHAGTRSMVATSGGGYDLMTETVSLAGIAESPLVIIIAQRPGPGTGLPTWTSQADLNLAIHSSHGEFSRVVISVSDPGDCFENIQHAFNCAEKYQVPVILLTDKATAESKMTLPPFVMNTIPIERGLVTGNDLEKVQSSDRFRITETGVSLRWLPGSSKTIYYNNGDEHEEDGTLTEDAEKSSAMYAKRIRKLELIREHLPHPIIYGDQKADISFVGWGSTKGVMLDIIELFREKNIAVNFLHYSFVFPLRTEMAIPFFKENKNVHLIEGNYTGQFGNLLEHEAGVKWKGRLLKWNGRPFFLEEVEQYIEKNLKKSSSRKILNPHIK